MANVPRKLLMVRPELSDRWNLMIEIDGRKTLSHQMTPERGQCLMMLLQDTVMQFLVQEVHAK